MTKPKFDKTEKCYDLSASVKVTLIVTKLLDVPPSTKKLSLGQLFYLANLPPEEFGDFCKDFYKWLDEMNCRAFVPLDNWRKVMN